MKNRLIVSTLIARVERQRVALSRGEDQGAGHDRGECPCNGKLSGWHRSIGPLPLLQKAHGIDHRRPADWVDHEYRERTMDGRWCWVAEPYVLDSEAWADFALLEKNGFTVVVTGHSLHFSGNAVAVFIVEDKSDG